MRDAIGGTMLFWIVLFFMTLFISFMAVVIQYARVYKTKNSTIDAIERSEGICSVDALSKYLSDYGYKGNYKICYYKPSTFSEDTLGGYYSLTLYATFSFSNYGFDMPVSGETRLIDTGICNGESIVSGAGEVKLGNYVSCVETTSKSN